MIKIKSKYKIFYKNKDQAVQIKVDLFKETKANNVTLILFDLVVSEQAVRFTLHGQEIHVLTVIELMRIKGYYPIVIKQDSI